MSDVCDYLIISEKILSERKNLHEYFEKAAERALQGEVGTAC